MASPYPTPPPSPENDIFSLSDQHLSERFQFVEEIGFGNWGSVWLCNLKEQDAPLGQDSRSLDKVAVKLVHRSKTSTTAARVRSLWNEMKIVRSFKHDPHPSIIPFHSFIITPSYALITMQFLPQLVPVEVGESKAREWFRSLLSGVEFLHKRGVVHNDIKPANILLSAKHVPVLVDFGFAERYEVGTKKAFLSNLAYGTPEYLSPERARGNLHDTRKSDMWSLGITFFEILIGRTPFEYTEGEQFSTKEDLEQYWSRTVKGKWVGDWKMTKPAERLLQKMIAPNADLRCTASEAMRDLYWTEKGSPPQLRAISGTMKSPSSVLMDSTAITTNLADVILPRTPCAGESKDKSPVRMLQKVENKRSPEDKLLVKPAASKSIHTPHKNRILVPAVAQVLSPVKASPAKVTSVTSKENVPPLARHPSAAAGLALGPALRKPALAVNNGQNHYAKSKEAKARELKERNRKGRVLIDLTGAVHNVDSPKKERKREKQKAMSKDRNLDRVKEFERLKEIERERMREEESEEEEGVIINVPRHDEESTVEFSPGPARPASPSFDDFSPDKFGSVSSAGGKTEAAPWFPTGEDSDNAATVNHGDLKLFPNDTFPRTGNESTVSVLKQSLKMSLDKTLRLYKSSTLGQPNKRSTPVMAKSVECAEEHDSGHNITCHESWDDEPVIRSTKSSLPVVQQAIRNERMAADNKTDRMTIWIRNVEQVVKDAQQNFASSSITALPPLPARPVIRSASHTRPYRQPRQPRRVMTAEQIFRTAFNDMSTTSAVQPNFLAPTETLKPTETVSTVPSEAPPTPVVSPSRARRATIMSKSPESPGVLSPVEIDNESPSKRKEKSLSSGNLNSLLRPISPLKKLQYELDRDDLPEPPPRLSDVFDRNIFIAGSGSTPALHAVPSISNISVSAPQNEDNLKSTPPHSDQIRQRTSTLRGTISSPTLTSPTLRHIEGVYDRFLMATSGVKRLGRGYQSDNVRPVQNMAGANTNKRNSKLLHSRRPMPPPVSSDDLRPSVNKSSMTTYGPYTSTTRHKDEGNNAVRIVRKALKAIVTGKTITRRQSRLT